MKATTTAAAATLQVLAKRLRPEAILPVRGSASAAGYDLYSAEECVIPAGGRYAVPTALALAIPEGCYGRIAPRSGLAAKHGIDVLAGVVDSDYRGEVYALLQNLGPKDFHVKHGDRVCQIIVEFVAPTTLQEAAELPKTLRGTAGFGSTGVSLAESAALQENLLPDHPPYTQ